MEPFAPTRESLSSYKVPEWYRDAKFGIWSHWGPQSAIERGDWYARNMYIQGSEQYNEHVSSFGHPSKVGYKDLIPIWNASDWHPDQLMKLYKKAGARYFVSMGVHHDNFDLWNSKYTRWNAASMGPKRDVVKEWREAAHRENLPFGVSEHLWISYKWFAVSHGADTSGAMANVPYDGSNERYADLYHDGGCARFDPDFKWDDDGIPDSWKKHYLDRMTDLIDQHEPDLLYTDGHLPFGSYGLRMVSHLYNVSARNHRGVVEAVYNSKLTEDCAVGTCVLDHERGVAQGISVNPWQTDTCIGDWHYKRGQQYKTAKKVIDLLTDIVSKNGNLLLNFPLPNSGQLDLQEIRVLEGITTWMETNSEGIYASRPWKIYGEGPSTKITFASSKFNEDKTPSFTAEDVRFTTKGPNLYAFVMGWPNEDLNITSLGIKNQLQPGRIERVEMLGHQGELNWAQNSESLHVTMPKQKISDIGLTLKISFG